VKLTNRGDANGKFPTYLRPAVRADICNGLLDPKSRYTIVRKDRVANRGGGVCAFVARKYAIVPVTMQDKYSDLELVGIDFIDFKPVLRLFVIYRPPQ